MQQGTPLAERLARVESRMADARYAALVTSWDFDFIAFLRMVAQWDQKLSKKQASALCRIETKLEIEP